MGGRARIRVATGLVAAIVASGIGAVAAMDTDGRGVGEAQTTTTTAMAANPDEIPVPAVPERASRDGARQAGAAREATVVADHWPVPGPPTVRSDFSMFVGLPVTSAGFSMAAWTSPSTTPLDARRPRRGDRRRRVSKIATLRGCSAITVGRFGYGHVRPRAGLEVGDRVAAGARIGTTCAGEWHVHVTEWSSKGDCEAGIPECRVNPLRPGGLLRLADSWAPEIMEVRRDGEELVARIDDPITQGFLDGSLAPLQVRHRPDRVWVGDRLVFVKRDMHDSPDDVFVGVGSETKRNLKAAKCLANGSTETSRATGHTGFDSARPDSAPLDARSRRWTRRATRREPGSLLRPDERTGEQGRGSLSTSPGTAAG